MITLAPDAAIDLQLHTTNSDGEWTPDALIDHLIAENFALAAITDHDRVDTIADVQALAESKGLPLLIATEMTTRWRGEITDNLCFGFDPTAPKLNALAQGILARQQATTRQVSIIILGR